MQRALTVAALLVSTAVATSSTHNITVIYACKSIRKCLLQQHVTNYALCFCFLDDLGNGKSDIILAGYTSLNSTTTQQLGSSLHSKSFIVTGDGPFVLGTQVSADKSVASFLAQVILDNKPFVATGQQLWHTTDKPPASNDWSSNASFVTDDSWHSSVQCKCPETQLDSATNAIAAFTLNTTSPVSICSLSCATGVATFRLVIDPSNNLNSSSILSLFDGKVTHLNSRQINSKYCTLF